MDHLTKVELAEQSGSSTQAVVELVELGILTPQADGSFRPRTSNGSSTRWRDRGSWWRTWAGPSDRGHLSFAFLDLLFTEPRAKTDDI